MAPDSERTHAWELALADLLPELRSWLRRRVPALAVQHDDLLNDAAESLLGHVRRDRDALPAAWFAPPDGAPLPRLGELRALAFTMLQRRVADRFRARVRTWAITADVGRDAADASVADGVSPDRALDLARILRATVLALDDLSDEDREIVTRVALDVQAPLDDRTRQRLRRARARIADALRQRFGDSISALLREDD